MRAGRRRGMWPLAVAQLAQAGETDETWVIVGQETASAAGDGSRDREDVRGLIGKAGGNAKRERPRPRERGLAAKRSR